MIKGLIYILKIKHAKKSEYDFLLQTAAAEKADRLLGEDNRALPPEQQILLPRKRKEQSRIDEGTRQSSGRVPVRPPITNKCVV